MSFKIGQAEIGLDKPLFVIAGPCVIEGESFCLDIANKLVEVSKNVDIPIIFKASFDKANRSSIASFRGPGLHAGLNILRTVREETGLSVLTDVHEPDQAKIASRFVDALQVPAFLCRQTDLVAACAETGLPINVKKGQFLSPSEILGIAGKMLPSGNDKIMFTERGTFFGYHRLVNDMTAIERMQNMGYPVVFDATHSIQTPGWKHCARRSNSLLLAKAAVAAGANGLFFEVHPEPNQAKSDGNTVIPIDWVEDLLVTCRKIFEIVR